MSKYFVNMTTILDIVRDDEIAILRTSLVRLCDGNFCAALILDDFYYRAYANDIYRNPHEKKAGYDRSLETYYSKLKTMMSDMFDDNAITEALNIIREKGYADISIEENTYIHFKVNLEKINRSLELLPGNQRETTLTPPVVVTKQSIAPSATPVAASQSKNGNPARRETRAVKFHNNRAEAVALPATLTIQQWQRTLKDFDNKCAYCQVNEYQVLEHYIPLNFGGGTTAYNCVPACVSCNGTKSDQHPSMITSTDKFINALQHVRVYLETRRKEDL